MTNQKIILYLVAGLILISVLFSCQQPGNNVTGSEYMPDMAHSVAYEANTYAYYYNNRWGTEEELHKMVQPRLPLAGTIARGIAGGNVGFGASDSNMGVAFNANGAKPYYYVDTEEDRTRASNELINNPFPITDDGLGRGKLLYNIYCSTCHGEKGDGAGYLLRDDGGKYPVQPANFLSDDFMAASNGRYYHGIVFGKNLMSGYTDKLSYEERWQVIHYIRSMQASSKKLEYSEKANTLNNVDVPNMVLKAAAQTKEVVNSETIN
ncbi:MAG: cytochrome c [Saprospiraceae bacterium]